MSRRNAGPGRGDRAGWEGRDGNVYDDGMGVDDYWRQVEESQQRNAYNPDRDAAAGLDWCGHPAPCPYCQDDPGGY